MCSRRTSAWRHRPHRYKETEQVKRFGTYYRQDIARWTAAVKAQNRKIEG